MGQSSRLDSFLVANRHYASRARAADAVRRGAVRVNGQVAKKAGMAVTDGAVIAIDDPAAGYVSRAALKLIAGLDGFGFDPTGLNALDLGASTGGFTQVLLERGAAHVTALDVGSGQMDKALAADPRVTLREGVNARALNAGHLTGPPDVITADLSFISLRLALPPALGLAAPGAFLVALIKPQFEAGRDALNKSGIVPDPATHDRVCGEIVAFLQAEGWRVHAPIPSPVKGGDGNQEFLVGARKGG